MAGEWIKVEVALDTKPEVFAMASALDRDPLHIVGMLWKVWAWADTHTLSGNAISVTSVTLDRLTNCPGFSDALRKVGWLEGRDGLLSFPRFERHNGQTAKDRALTAKRVALHKSRKGNDSVTLGALPKEEVDKRRIPTSSSDEESVGSGPTGLPDDEAWMAELQRQFADRDVAGERVSFLAFCQRKGTAANRSGFVGWLKKASPKLQNKPKEVEKW